jgi:hypothetical protein
MWGRWLRKKNTNGITYNMLIFGGRIHKICIFYKGVRPYVVQYWYFR